MEERREKERGGGEEEDEAKVEVEGRREEGRYQGGEVEFVCVSVFVCMCISACMCVYGSV